MAAGLLVAGLALLLLAASGTALEGRVRGSAVQGEQAPAVTAHHGSLPAAGDGAPTAEMFHTPDAVCAQCHAAIYDTYEKTSKARGSGLARDALLPGSFKHGSSGIRYEVGLKDGAPQLSYRRVEPRKGAELAGEVPLSYFIGSGKRGRTYLFAQPAGAGRLWFEAPVNWYTRRAAYDMAPAYDRTTTMPFTLPVDANCLHCHASEVQQPLEAARNAFAGAPFLQAGVGCAACHGDGTAHVMSGGKVAVVDARKLKPARRDSLCLQCHLEGDAVVYRAGRSLADFRAGDDLSETAVYFVNRSSEKTMRRASSQYEALLRSACRRAVGDALTCTTCHDPHSTPTPAERVAYFRAKCLACHTGAKMAEQHFARQPDCASCHMPTRDTADISHEQLTDHDIERRPRLPEGSATMREVQLAVLGQAEPLVSAQSTAADLVPVGDAVAGDRERGLAYAQFAARGDRVALSRALSLLHKAEFLSAGRGDARLHEELGYLEQIRGDAGAAEREYAQALAVDAGNATVATNLAVLAAAKGDQSRAVFLLRQVAAGDPSQTASLLDLAAITCQAGDAQSARAVVRRALVFNPDSAEAHLFLEKGVYAGHRCGAW